MALSYIKLKQPFKAKNAFALSAPAYLNDVTWHINFGILLADMFELEEARKICLKAIELDSTHRNIIWVWNYLAIIELRKEDIPKAISYYEKALSINPKEFQVLTNFARLYISNKNLTKAKELFERGLEIAEELCDEKKIARVRIHLANLSFFHLNKTAEETLVYLRPLIPLGKHSYTASVADFMLHLKLHQNEWDDLEGLITSLKEGIGKDDIELLNPFNMLSIYGVTEMEHKKIADKMMRNGGDFRENRIKPFPKRPLKSLKNRPLRLGILSSDLLQWHPVRNVSKRVLEILSKEESIELYIYSNSVNITLKEYNSYLEEFLKITPKIYEVHKTSDIDLAKQIYADKIDILIDLNGHTKGERLSVHTYHPASIIINWLGYPSTIGGSSHDWIIADKYTIPIDSESAFTERVYRLPVSYFPTDDQREIPQKVPNRLDFGLPIESFVFAGFSNTYKINPDVFDTWCKILSAVPKSVLWLKEYGNTDKKIFRKEAKKRDIDPSRLIFAKRVPTDQEYLESLGMADLALDSWPYNLHATCIDFLSAGVPVLTLRGETFAGRVGESLLNAFGMPDMVAKDRKTYMQKAIDIATNKKRLNKLKDRAKIYRTSSKLFDSKGMAMHLKDAFYTIYEKALKEERDTPTTDITQMTIADALKKALSLHKENKADEAKSIYKMVLKVKPTQADALHFLGVISYQERKYKESLELLNRAKPMLKNNAAWNFHYGRLMYALDDFDMAEKLYLNSLKLDKKMFEAWLLLGKLYVLKQEYTKAEECYTHAYKLKTDDTDILFLIGELYNHKKEYQTANKIFHKILKESKTLCTEIVARFELAKNLRLQGGDTKIALKYLNPILPKLTQCTSMSSHGSLAGLAFYIKMLSNDWRDTELLIDIMKKRLQEKELTISPFYLLFSNRFSAEEQYIASNLRFESVRRNIAKPFPLRRVENKTKQALRLGVISSDLLSDHPVFYAVIRVFELLAQKGVEIYIYSLKEFDDGIFPENVDRLYNCTTKIDELTHKLDIEIARHIYQDNIEILLDLNGLTKGHRYGVFKYKPAPIIVNWLGYPGTVGGEYHDWIIGDKYVTPKTEEKNFSEKIWRMPHTYFPTDNKAKKVLKKPSREEYGLPLKGIVFGSLSNSFKINPEVFDVWCKILTLTPNSVLWLSKSKETNIEELYRQAELRGVSKERVVFANRVPTKEEHHARLGLVDIALDTWPYNMHTTCIDFLWAGVPVLTLKGKTFAGCVGESLLCSSNLSDMIANNTDEYIQKATQLAKNPTELKILKERVIKSQTESKLFDSESMASDLKEAFMSMLKIKIRLNTKEKNDKK